MNWVAYCIDCGKEIDSAPNGSMVEASGRLHTKGEYPYRPEAEHEDGHYSLGHRVLVGYYIKEN
ncbi:MAG: hypothetical protein ACLQF0_06730 [Dissulfurispiraceae bacterium]